MTEQRLREALTELVACKGLKESRSYDDMLEYQSRQPLAWKAAIAALASPIAAPADEARDAARYRWLRTFDVDSYLAVGRMETLDAAIDAAIEAQSQKGEGA